MARLAAERVATHSLAPCPLIVNVFFQLLELIHVFVLCGLVVQLIKVVNQLLVRQGYLYLVHVYVRLLVQDPQHSRQLHPLCLELVQFFDELLVVFQCFDILPKL